MIRVVVIVVLAIVALAGVAEAGKRDCVAIGKGKVVYADASKQHPVGTTTAKVAAEVEQRKGAWVKVRIDDLHMDEGGAVWSSSHVYVFVRKRDTKRGACPPRVNIAIVGLIDSWTDLYWRHGDEAGWVEVSDFASALRCNGDDVMVGEVQMRCGAWSPVKGLAVDACADAADPPGGDLAAALGGDPCAK